MVALTQELEVSGEGAQRFFTRHRTYRSGAVRCSKLSCQSSLRRGTYDECEQLESCSRDPIGFGDGFNFFAFLAQNPLVLVDPIGLATLDADPASAGGAPFCNVGLGYKYYYDKNGNPTHEPNDYDPRNGLPEDVVGRTDDYAYYVECGCTCCDPNSCNGKQRVKCRVVVRLQIRISQTAIDTAPPSKRIYFDGTYGHEQLHIKNLLRRAAEIRDALTKLEQLLGCVNQQTCKGKATAWQQNGTSMLKQFLAHEKTHPGIPKKYTMYPSQGGVGPEVPCGDVDPIRPFELTPCSQ